MLKKENVKGFVTGAAAALTAATMVTAFAEPVEQIINAYFGDYRIIIDGADKSDAPDDSKPFIYNGRTYVPLRYIGEAMGKQVLWDGDTSTIYINDEGTKREDVYFSAIGYDSIETTDSYHISSDSGIYLNNEEKTVYLFVNSSWSDWSYTSSITYNLNGIAKKVLGEVDMSETSNDAAEGKVVFYDQNDKVLYELPTMRSATETAEFEFDVSGVLQLRAEFITSSASTGKTQINLKNFRYSK
ncbi:MAG: hypothetical protein LIO59_02880 [Oscillospiraceae bacterium]|nr:hypothetical protein [Oscillospiraceae bacterium]